MTNPRLRDHLTKEIRRIIPSTIVQQTVPVVVQEVVRIVFDDHRAIGVHLEPHTVGFEKHCAKRMLTEQLIGSYEPNSFVSVGDTVSDLIPLMVKHGFTLTIKEV